MFTIQLGGHKRVVLSEYDNLYQVLVKNGAISSGRSPKALSKMSEEVAKKAPGMNLS